MIYSFPRTLCWLRVEEDSGLSTMDFVILVSHVMFLCRLLSLGFLYFEYFESWTFRWCDLRFAWSTADSDSFGERKLMWNCGNISLGLHSARYLNFRKNSHLQPLAATRVAASGRSVEWPQVTASGRLRRVAEVFQSHKKQPLAATRSHSSGRKWPLFPSGRKWPRVAAFPEWPQVAASGRLYHITSWIRNWGKHPLAAAGSLPIHLNLKKNTFPTKHIFSRCSRLSPRSIA